MKEQFSALQAQVAQTLSVEQSAITLIQGLKTSLDVAIANSDWAGVQTLSDSLGSGAQQLASAIMANTPPTPAPPSTAPGATGATGVDGSTGGDGTTGATGTPGATGSDGATGL